jgi:predicted N-acetyltransferase YhbS
MAPGTEGRYRVDGRISPGQDVRVPDAVAVRSTIDEDRDAVLDVVRSAFCDSHRDGDEELAIVTRTWSLGGSVNPIDLVAVDGARIVGHVLAASGRLGDREVLAVAPLAVAPARHRQGVGSSLMGELLRSADEAGWPLAVLLGSPDYYARFGFVPSAPLGIMYRPAGPANPHFQVRPLRAYGPSWRGEFTYCWEP